MATHQAADMEPNLTECAVCHDLFAIPKLLPCSHILCRGCLVTWLQSQPQAGCPLCRYVIMDPVEHKWRSVEEVVDGFPTDLAMTAMVKAETLLSKQHVCCVCVNVAAVALCLQCGETFCQSCSNLHQKQTATKHHDVEQLNSLTTERLATHHPATCPIHQDKVSEVYCPSHDASVCVLCATTTHRNCPEVVSLSTKIDELTAELFQLDDRLAEAVTRSGNVIERLDKHVQEIERDSQASLTELRNVCDRLKAAIDARFLSVKAETLDFICEVTKRVTDFKKHAIQTRSKNVTQKKMTELYRKFTQHKHFKDMVTIAKGRSKEICKVDDPPDNLQVNRKQNVSPDPLTVADIEINISKLGGRKFTSNNIKSKTQAQATKTLFQDKDLHGEQFPPAQILGSYYPQIPSLNVDAPEFVPMIRHDVPLNHSTLLSAYPEREFISTLSPMNRDQGGGEDDSGAGADAEEVLLIEFSNTLLTLTTSPGNYVEYLRPLLDKLRECHSPEVFTHIINLLYEQCVYEPNFRYTGVKVLNFLCCELRSHPIFGAFKGRFLKRCQEDYNRRDDLIRNGDAEGLLTVCGLALFMGELFCKVTIDTGGQTETLAFLSGALTDLLLTLVDYPSDSRIKTACQLLKFAGGQTEDALKDEASISNFNLVFKHLESINDSTSLTKNIQLLIQSVLALRKNNWGRLEVPEADCYVYYPGTHTPVPDFSWVTLEEEDENDYESSCSMASEEEEDFLRWQEESLYDNSRFKLEPVFYMDGKEVSREEAGFGEEDVEEEDYEGIELTEEEELEFLKWIEGFQYENDTAYLAACR